MKQNTLNTVVLYNSEARQWLRFSSPKQVVSTNVTSEVIPLLQYIENIVEAKNLYAAGFLSYESAPAFDGALRVKKAGKDFPLLWFGLYKKPSRLFSTTRMYRTWDTKQGRGGHRSASVLIKKISAALKTSSAAAKHTR
jgi:hypothetical protein